MKKNKPCKHLSTGMGEGGAAASQYIIYQNV